MQTGKRTAEKRWTKSTILAQIFCVIMLVIWLYPLIKIIQISFRSGGIENYKRVLFTVDSFSIANGYVKDIADFWVYLGNSMTVTAIDMALVLSITSLGAFAFSKMDFKGKEAHDDAGSRIYRTVFHYFQETGTLKYEIQSGGTSCCGCDSHEHDADPKRHGRDQRRDDRSFDYRRMSETQGIYKDDASAYKTGHCHGAYLCIYEQLERLFASIGYD